MTSIKAIIVTFSIQPFSLRTLMLASMALLSLSAHSQINQERNVCVGLTCITVVEVGDPGNPADTQTGLGSVAQSFAIGKYEITLEQYLHFLNAVATRPYSLPEAKRQAILDLWLEDMQKTHDYVSKDGLIERLGQGTDASPFIFREIPDTQWGERSGKRAMLNISWFAAARFANWMHHGATDIAETETGAYTLNGARSGVVRRNADARWWIPSLDEWYKAAFYDPTRTDGQAYWTYPTRSDTLPDNKAIPGGMNSANYNSGQPAGQRITPVGSYTHSISYYGTYDQAGLLWEWSDTSFANHDGQPSTFALLGGSWSLGQVNVSKHGGRDYLPQYNDDDTGFRLATRGVSK